MYFGALAVLQSADHLVDSSLGTDQAQKHRYFIDQLCAEIAPGNPRWTSCELLQSTYRYSSSPGSGWFRSESRFRTTMPFKCTEKPLRNQLSSIVTSTISSPFLLWIASSIARWI
jgi:hypothetical protein